MFKITVETKGDIILLRLYGALTSLSIQEAEEILNKEMGKRPEVMAIDFGELERIDSMGISRLVRLAKSAIVADIELILFDLAPSIKDVMHIAQLDRFFNIMTRELFEEDYLKG